MSDEEYLEMTLIGSLLRDASTFPEVAAIVKPTAFLVGSALQCWLLMVQHYKDGHIDMGSVYVGLQPGDKPWFTRATSDEITPAGRMAIYTARKIVEAAKKRRIVAELQAITLKASEIGVNSDWLLEDMIAAYKRETGEVDRDSSIGAVVERFKLVQATNLKNGRLGFRTGFDLLQKDYVVYQPGHLWVVGAWTSVGKSAYMVESLSRFFTENKGGRAAVFSTEMTEEQNVARILANKTGISANVILSGQILDSHVQWVEEQTEWIIKQSFHVYDKLRNVDEIMAQCRKLKYGGGIDLVFIDFVQNLTKAGGKDQYIMTAQIARDLQALAHDLRCTVVCLSQIPNSAGKEDSGILEFKGAGEIAAACDVGVLMKRSKEDDSVILFDVRKNRHGKCGKYLLKFDAGWTRIIELEAVA